MSLHRNPPCDDNQMRCCSSGSTPNRLQMRPIAKHTCTPNPTTATCSGLRNAGKEYADIQTGACELEPQAESIPPPMSNRDQRCCPYCYGRITHSWQQDRRRRAPCRPIYRHFATSMLLPSPRRPCPAAHCLNLTTRLCEGRQQQQ
ncbi:hypothetical protein K439DRAFT_380617 [Ramaria rubella]|nr:hypothetical protein K439DRAFT_380617 [Ramaria rubella]